MYLLQNALSTTIILIAAVQQKNNTAYFLQEHCRFSQKDFIQCNAKDGRFTKSLYKTGRFLGCCISVWVVSHSCFYVELLHYLSFFGRGVG
ncbi:hypothetical protein GDO78_001929 [Eleutherodactylus coqui]|uniref:Uncharacterized protein n=1 Tax=Eleutherodactylus coqui TaxID=57060 RepID=A0A8J6FUC5_ELECQ|nr:hypothetical protein GDO78_001929 [Eleutherodactylus coqui]